MKLRIPGLAFAGSALKAELAKLTIPIFIETLLIMTLGAVDTFMLSRYSDASVAAVGVVNQIIMVCFLVFEVINVGTSVLVSQYVGAGLAKRTLTAIIVALAINLVSGVLMSGALYLFSSRLLGAMGLHGEMLDEGYSYMRIVGIFAFFQAISLTLSASLRASNRAVWPMGVVAVVNLINIFGNYSLIFGHFGMPALGVTGAAISTATCRGISMVVLGIVVYRLLFRGNGPLKNMIERPGHELKNLLRVGLPSAGEQFSYSLSQIVLTYFINMMGLEALATRTYTVNIVMFVYLFCISISHGGAIAIGHLVGHGKTHGAFILGRFVMKVATMVTLVLSTITAFCGHAIFSFLTDNEEIVRLGTHILFIDVAVELGRAINIYTVNALRAVGDVNFPFYVGVIFMWSVAVVGGYLAGIVAGFGILGMWVAFAADENIRAIIFVRRWNNMKWAGKAFVKE